MLPFCEVCGEQNPYALIDSYNEFVCIECELTSNVLDEDDGVLRHKDMVLRDCHSNDLHKR